MASGLSPEGAAISTRSWVVSMLAAVLTLGVTALFPVWTNDLFGHLAAGRQIVELGYVPDHDTFSFYFDTPRPWHNHNWASCVVFYIVQHALGFDALVWLKVLLCGALGAILVLSCERRSLAAAITPLLLLWGALAVRERFTVRPHLLGLLACALLLHVLLEIARSEPQRGHWKRIAALAALQLAWVNLHGSGPMAWLLTAAFLVGHHGHWAHQRWYLRLLLVQAAVSCITPAGAGMLLATFEHVSSNETRFFIGEWGPLSESDNAWAMPAWLGASVLALWAAKPLWKSGALGRSWLLMTCGTLVMAYHSLRFIAEPLLLGAPCIATGIAMRIAELARWKRVAAALVLGSAGVASSALAASHLPPYQPVALGVSTRNLPAEPGRWLAAHRPHARSTCAMEDCWYLSYAVPQGLVAFDGRQAVYPLEVMQHLAHAMTEPRELFEVLDQKHADAVVLRHNRPDHARSISALLQRTDYGIATIGDRHVLFVRGLARDESIWALWPSFALRAFDAKQAARAKLELQRIGSHPGSSAYVGFQRALLLLSPYLRAGGYDGLQPATQAAQRALYAQALSGLSPALVPNENFPSAQALATLLNLQLCALDDAARSLELASVEGNNRSTLASRIELAIRQGHPQQAREMIAALAGSGPDAWLDELAQECTAALTTPACPP